MKSTKAFMCTARSFMWEESDWVDGQLTIELELGTKVVGFQTFLWEGEKRTPVNWSAKLLPNKLIVSCDSFEPRKSGRTVTEEGCVTLYLHSGM